MTRAVITLEDLQASRGSYQSYSRTIWVCELLVYGHHDGVPFVAQGRVEDGGRWTGLWSWTCGKMLGDSVRRSIIRLIKEDPRTEGVLAAAVVPDDPLAFQIGFYLAHGERHVVPYSDAARRAELKARGAVFFKVEPEPFWLALT